MHNMHRALIILAAIGLLLCQVPGSGSDCLSISPTLVTWDGTTAKLFPLGQPVETLSIHKEFGHTPILGIYNVEFVDRSGLLSLAEFSDHCELDLSSILSNYIPGTYCFLIYTWYDVLKFPYQFTYDMHAGRMLSHGSIFDDMIIEPTYSETNGFTINLTSHYPWPGNPGNIYVIGPDSETDVIASIHISTYSCTTQIDVPYRGLGDYKLVWASDLDEHSWPDCDCLTEVGYCCATRMTIHSSISVTVSPSWIEPALNDTLSIKYTRSGLRLPGAIIIYDQNDRIIRRFPITDPSAYSGEFIFDGKDDEGNCLEAGRYYIGIDYDYGDDDPTAVSIGYFAVRTTVYDVYTNNTPLYIGDPTQGQTTVHYSLSTDASSATVNVGGKSITGTANKGENQVTWDGTMNSGDFVDSGVYGISISAPYTGSSLNVSSPNRVRVSDGVEYQSTSFAPAADETFRLRYTISEPCKRPQATSASMYSKIYDLRKGNPD